MGNTKMNLRSLILPLLGCLLVAMPLAARPLQVEVGSDTLTVTALKAYSLDVRISGPEGVVFQQTFDGATAAVPFADDEGNVLPDGVYTFEVTGNPAPRTRGEDAEISVEAERATGSFTLAGGRAMNPNLREGGITKDIVHADDVIAQFSMCVGVDCVNGESFGFDTFRLKENNLRIHFDDTSNSSSFPANDWRIVANDSSNGGASYLAIEDSTAGRQVFRVDAGSQSNSIYVKSNQGVGFGTSSPLTNSVHVANGNSPALRLEQNGSNGFTAQTWDMAGNEANFFIRDVTNGSALPFRIEPGAHTNALYIDSTDNIGMGTNAPKAPLHILGSGSAFDTGFASQMLTLQNNGSAGDGMIVSLIPGSTGTGQITFGDSSSVTDGRIIYSNLNDTMDIQTNGAIQMSIDSSGNVNVTGTLTTGGPQCGGSGCDRVFSPDYDLPSIEEHAARMWSESYLPAVGPTPEDGTPFNVTEKTGGMLNELEKAHIFIEQLHTQIQELRDRVDQLEKSGDQ